MNTNNQDNNNLQIQQIEEKTNNLIKNMGDKFNNLINSINFRTNDNELDSKVNKINKEMLLITNKMKNGKTFLLI